MLNSSDCSKGNVYRGWAFAVILAQVFPWLCLAPINKRTRQYPDDLPMIHELLKYCPQI